MSLNVGIILAAGEGTRMGKNKMLMKVAGHTPLELCVRAMEQSNVDRIIIVTAEDVREFAESLPCRKPKTVIRGGDTRGQSAQNAVLTCNDDDIVVIHDGARCLVTAEIIEKSVECARKYGSGIASMQMCDTVRTRDGRTVDRNELLIMQTPQTFRCALIRDAYAKVGTGSSTDDCGVFIAAGNEPYYFESSLTNQKLTSPADIEFFENALRKGAVQMRIGYGEDTHRLCAGRALVLGGATLDYHMGLLGHSDADVICHSISDALLGACALGDIGKLFPDTDPSYKDAKSLDLLSRVVQVVFEKGFEVVNVDTTVIAQEPKLAPYIDGMRNNISRAINTNVSCVSIKATTPEGTGAEGRLECITARAVVVVRQGR